MNHDLDHINPNLLVSGVPRYLATNETKSAFTYTASGIEVGSALTLFDIRKALSARIYFIGTGANNSQYTATIWLYDKILDDARSAANNVYVRNCAGVVDVTLGTSVGTGSSASVLLSTERVADTVEYVKSATAAGATTALSTAVPIGPMTDWENAYSEGSSAAFTNIGNAPGGVILPCLGRSHYMSIDFEVASTATAANAIIVANRI